VIAPGAPARVEPGPRRDVSQPAANPRPGPRRPADWLDGLLAGIGRHWLGALNALVVLFVAGALAAPTLEALGAAAWAAPLYAAYHAACHQWAFRSFFLFGPQAVAIYSPEQLRALGVDPYTFVGGPASGWKMAFCERDLAIYAGLLVFGALYAARWRPSGLAGMGFLAYGLAVAPLALDGFTQLFGWRESTWELRLATGLVFGLASGWLLYPRVDEALRR
jgi:uncharacterized membrane protein